MNLFIHYDGRCPYCKGPVNIVEGLVYEYTLDESGLPNCLDSEQYKVAGYCMNCSTELIIVPNDVGGYIAMMPNESSSMLIPEINKNKRISILGNTIIKSEDNPFTNIMDDDECPF